MPHVYVVGECVMVHEEGEELERKAIIREVGPGSMIVEVEGKRVHLVRET